MNGEQEGEETYDGGRPYNPPPVFTLYPDEPGGFNQSGADRESRLVEPRTPRTPPRPTQAKFKSSSRQAEIFIHDPRNALLGQNAAIDGWDPGITSEITDLPSRILRS